MTLIEDEIVDLKAKKSSFYVWDDDGKKGFGQLGIKVYPSESKTFVFRYYKNSVRVFIQLGRFPQISLLDAREKAKELGLFLSQGIDPKEHLEAIAKQKEQEKKKQEKEEQERKDEDLLGTIEQLFHSYTMQMQKDGKRTFEDVLTALEKEAYPFIDKKTKARDVTTKDCINILAHMIRRGAPTQSNRVRSYLMAAFNHGLRHDNDPANYFQESKFGLSINPVSPIPKQKYAERVGDHFLVFAEIRQLLEDLQETYDVFPMSQTMRHLIQLCIYLGGQRPYEIVASRWYQVDWEGKTLEIPGSLAKNGKPSTLHLTESAICILQKQYKLSGNGKFIFPGRSNQKNHIKTSSIRQAINRYLKVTPNVRSFTPRDMRRTGKTLMGKIGIPKLTRDRIHNHALNDVSSRHYDRYDYQKEVKAALEQWEEALNQTLMK